jgi:hypothetical protein
MPVGTTPSQVFLYMAMNHGLTAVTCQKYLNELQLGGMLTIQMGRILIRRENLKKMIEAVVPTRDPTTGDKLTGDIDLALNGSGLEEGDEKPAKAPKRPRKKAGDKNGVAATN